MLQRKGYLLNILSKDKDKQADCTVTGDYEFNVEKPKDEV